jgi:hypothetical protein
LREFIENDAADDCDNRNDEVDHISAEDMSLEQPGGGEQRIMECEPDHCSKPVNI